MDGLEGGREGGWGGGGGGGGGGGEKVNLQGHPKIGEERDDNQNVWALSGINLHE